MTHAMMITRPWVRTLLVECVRGFVGALGVAAGAAAAQKLGEVLARQPQPPTPTPAPAFSRAGRSKRRVQRPQRGSTRR
jgi:hypothetical protein